MLTSILVTIIVVTKIESVGKDLNFRVYILAIAAFVVGTVELIIGGTLDLVANDLEYLLVQLVSLSQYFQ